MNTRSTSTMIMMLIFWMILGGMLISPPLQAAQPLSDQEIADAVEDKIQADGAVPVSRLQVTTEAGVVTLSGTVPTLLAKERALRLAESLRGVKSVVNLIQVKTINRDDVEIRKDIEKAFLRNPAIKARNLSPDVRNGVVTISGDVQSWTERDLALKMAEAVKGVRDVKDAISIRFAGQRSDPEILDDVVQALKWDALLKHSRITAKVTDGTVKLTGSVVSAAQKSRAKRVASVAGVKKVDASELEVTSPAGKQPEEPMVTDAQIQQAVVNALQVDPRTSTYKISVDVTGRVATLRGTVETLEAKRAAKQDAMNTRGIIAVKNRLKVQPTLELDDASVAKRVREALAADPLVESYQIGVSVIGNVAYLSGTVDASYQKTEAEFAASTVTGVIDVVNGLAVRNPAAPSVYDPFVDYFIFYDLSGPASERAKKNEAQLRQDIRDQFYWSPFVDADQVKVTVKDGVVTLTGTVDSNYEKEMAAKNAFDGGASVVVNELKVK
ncbi:BON domain-containing protein [Pelotalea chapellei]|uniref:BON domain-containing protein n=1 Tax=Pelotalea chapellei TaxID=44671 RepID=A0ABS5U3X6_9BACT|nr:BON domain-containing protein [Pelotalea chapellei]MBT1070334.1 BON domain-containing protein [Pelotalea chapellei]